LDCGIFVDDERIVGLSDNLSHEEDHLRNFQSHFGIDTCRSRLCHGCDVRQEQIVYTDGACKNNQDHRFRRAGYGIYYGSESCLNFSSYLPGLQQSNQRAELFAVLVACLRDPRPLDIRSDSAYVCDGVQRLHCPHGEPCQKDHTDLWALLASELATRESHVSVSWVLGHAKPIDVQRGRTTLADKLGNDGADALAVQGAVLHEIDADILSQAQQRCETARQVHRMMLQILKARLAAEKPDEGLADRGSEVSN